jgi:hypothetical protein
VIVPGTAVESIELGRLAGLKALTWDCAKIAPTDKRNPNSSTKHDLGMELF